jgi:hypothetical protein
VSEHIDATAQCWAAAQRVGVKIAALPTARARQLSTALNVVCVRLGVNLVSLVSSSTASLTFKCGLFGKSSLTLTLTMVPQPRK